MLEQGEASGFTPKVEVIYTQNQERPFGVERVGASWQLSVSRAYFESRGYMPDEINGAVFLEEERLGRHVGTRAPSAVAGLRRWQEVGDQKSPHATVFKGAFERLAALASLEEKDTYKASLARRYLEKLAARSPGPTGTDQLFSALLSEGLGHHHDTASLGKVVKTIVNNLKKTESIEGREVSPLDALVSPDLSYAAKASWFDSRFLPRLEFLERQDRQIQQQEEKERERQHEQERKDQPQEQPEPTPTPAQDEYEQHRGREEKGKGTPTFVINPAYTGYWEEDSFDAIEEQSGRLTKSPAQRIRTAMSTIAGQIIEGTGRTISGNTGEALFGLPLAPGFQLTPEGLTKLRAQGIEVFTDAEGHTFVQPASNIKMSAEIAMSRNPTKFGINSKDEQKTDQMPDETERVLFRIRTLTATSLEKLQEWKNYISASFKYPKDERVQGMYAAIDGSSSRLSSMMQGQLLDCYLAREFFIAGLKRLNLADVKWRAVNGDYIAGPQKDGTAHISSGTHHAWVKVRVPQEKNWIIFDATPPGDPIHQEEGAMDEFEESTPDPFSEQDMGQLEKEASENQKKSSATQDQYLLQFARMAGISEAEARPILSTLAKVDEMKDRRGRNILARVKEQFNKIIDKYTQTRQENLGNIEMSRGQDLDDPVTAYMDLRAGSSDPLGFDRKRMVEDVLQYYSGWDLEIGVDGSASMNEILGGRVKYKVQQEMGYLMHRAQHWFSQEAQRRKLRLVTPLKIRSSEYIFRGNKVEEIKPLNEEFTPLQMAALWKKSAENIGGTTPAHLVLQAILDKIPPNDVKLLQDKQLLKVVALISDGDYDDPGKVAGLINRLNALNVVVAEFRITDAQSLEDLPENVAAKVIEAAAILMPKRIQKR